jgi:hypothetical protein
MIYTFKVCNNKNKDSKMAKRGNKNAAGPHKKTASFVVGGFVSGMLHAPKHNQRSMIAYASKSTAGLRAYKVGAAVRKASGVNLFLK